MTSLKSFLLEDKKLIIIYDQYYGWWRPGDARSHGISTHGIDIDCPKYLILSTRSVDTLGLFYRHNLSEVKAWISNPHILHDELESWWRHQMEAFCALLALCVGNSPVTSEIPSQRPVTWSFGVFFDLRLNIRLSKHSRRRWFDTPSRSSWRHCNGEILWDAFPHPCPPVRRTHHTAQKI